MSPTWNLGDEQVDISVPHALPVADPRGHVPELAAESKALFDGVGRDDSGGAAV
jgi:hypothetical protein